MSSIQYIGTESLPHLYFSIQAFQIDAQQNHLAEKLEVFLLKVGNLANGSAYEKVELAVSFQGGKHGSLMA